MHFKSLSVCASNMNDYVFACVRVCMFVCIWVGIIKKPLDMPKWISLCLRRIGLKVEFACVRVCMCLCRNHRETSRDAQLDFIVSTENRSKSGIIFQLGYYSGHIGNPFSPLFYPHRSEYLASFHLMWPRINNQNILDLV